jgi:hypothetical protein
LWKLICTHFGISFRTEKSEREAEGRCVLRFSRVKCVSAFISTQKNWVKNRWFQSKFINSWTAEPVSEWNSCMRRPRNMRPNIVSEVISFPIQDLQILNSVNCCFRDFLCYCDYLLLISIWCNWTGRVAY